MKQLITNADGRLSTTATGQLVGLIVLAIVLLYASYMGRDNVTELFIAFASYCGGLTLTKGVVTSYRDAQSKREQ